MIGHRYDLSHWGQRQQHAAGDQADSQAIVVDIVCQDQCLPDAVILILGVLRRLILCIESLCAWMAL